MKARILIADDDAPIRGLLRRLLEEDPDWKICGEAVDGEDAVAQVLELNPDVAVLDLAMPQMNGLQAGRRISAVKPGLPMVLLTVQGLSTELLEQARLAGFRGAVSKRRGTEVVDAVKILLEKQGFFALGATDLAS